MVRQVRWFCERAGQNRLLRTATGYRWLTRGDYAGWVDDPKHELDTSECSAGKLDRWGEWNLGFNG